MRTVASATDISLSTKFTKTKTEIKMNTIYVEKQKLMQNLKRKLKI